MHRKLLEQADFRVRAGVSSLACISRSPAITVVSVAAGKTLLIVEDDEDLRRLFRTTLLFAGYQVHEAGDGLTALQILDLESLDGVILDLDLPVLPGHVVRDEIVAHAETRRLPLVIVTGLPGPHEGPGVDCVLRKPTTPERLLQVVAECIAASTAAGRGIAASAAAGRGVEARITRPAGRGRTRPSRRR